MHTIGPLVQWSSASVHMQTTWRPCCPRLLLAVLQPSPRVRDLGSPREPENLHLQQATGWCWVAGLGSHLPNCCYTLSHLILTTTLGQISRPPFPRDREIKRCGHPVSLGNEPGFKLRSVSAPRCLYISTPSHMQSS